MNAENPDHVVNCFAKVQLFCRNALLLQSTALPTVGPIFHHHFKATTRERCNKREWRKDVALVLALPIETVLKSVEGVAPVPVRRRCCPREVSDKELSIGKLKKVFCGRLDSHIEWKIPATRSTQEPAMGSQELSEPISGGLVVSGG